MTLPMEYALEVREDLDAAYAWYEEQQTGLGERFMTAVSDLVSRIQSNPERFGRVRGEVRAGLVHRFPYVVYFRVEESRIVIIAVLHGHRDPQIWIGRI